MNFDKHISEKGSYLSCVTNGEFRFSVFFLSSRFLSCLFVLRKRIINPMHNNKGHGWVAFKKFM